MADWNPLLYLKFSGERTRPAEDLAGSLPLRAPARVLDIGCGPGNSTAVLSRRFPAAELLGVDASPAMVRQAQAAFPQWQFRVCTLPEGLRALDGGWDVVFSNACLQWVPGHRQLIPALFGLLSQGGVLAVYATQTDPFTAAVAAVNHYNLAGVAAAAAADAPASFKVAFIDELFRATPEAVAGNSIEIQEA